MVVGKEKIGGGGVRDNSFKRENLKFLLWVFQGTVSLFLLLSYSKCYLKMLSVLQIKRFTSTKIKLLVLFKEVMVVYAKNHPDSIITFSWQNAELMIIKEVVHIFTTGLLTVNFTWLKSFLISLFWLTPDGVIFNSPNIFLYRRYIALL
jgi:hypothetical protein